MESIFIGDTEIRQTEDGLYCLNDFHKAAGGQEKHKPKFFLENFKTQEVVKYLISLNDGIPPFEQNQVLRVAVGGPIKDAVKIALDKRSK